MRQQAHAPIAPSSSCLLDLDSFLPDAYHDLVAIEQLVKFCQQLGDATADRLLRRGLSVVDHFIEITLYVWKYAHTCPPYPAAITFGRSFSCGAHAKPRTISFGSASAKYSAAVCFPVAARNAR